MTELTTRKSVFLQRLSIECPVHKCLNKYYLKNQNKFVCEYDGFDKDGPDSFWHLPQILENNRARILKLQSGSLSSASPELHKLLPYASNEYQNLSSDTNKLANLVQSLAENVFMKMTDNIFSNESYNDIKDIISQINFNAQGKPDLRKIGMDATKERNLITLAQLLILNKDKEPEKALVYEDLLNFIFNFQERLIELINQGVKTVDFLNGDFACEIAKLEGKIHDPNKRINKFRSMYMTRVEHESILRERELEWAKKNAMIEELTNNLNSIKAENFKLTEYIKKLSLDRETEKKNFLAEIEALKRQLAESNQKANDYYKKKISELELLLIEREKEISELRKLYDTDILEMKKKNDVYILSIRSEYKTLVDELEAKLHHEQANGKKIALERDNLHARLNDALARISKLEEELKFQGLSSDKRVQYFESQLRELRLMKEKLDAELINERNRYNELNDENMELRKKINELNLRIVDLDEYIKNQGLDQQKHSSSLQLQLQEMRRLKEQWEKKYNSLEISFQEERAKYNSTITLLEKRCADLNEQIEELRKINNSYLDRISDIEHELYDLRNQVSRLEAEKSSLNQTIIDLQNQLNMHLSNSKNLKSDELRKIAELTSQVNNFPKIKDLLNNRIKELEELLSKEKSESLKYQKEAELKMHTLQVSVSDLSSENMTLEHQIELLRSELDNEKSRQQKKINELTLLLQEVTKLKDKNQSDFNDERTRLTQQILDLERRLKELQYQYEENSGKNDYNFKRLRELEILLNEERAKYERLSNDYEKKIAELTQRIIDLQRNNEGLQRRYIELERDLADEKSKTNQLLYDKDNLVKLFKEKEANYNKIIEELRRQKLDDDKTISDLSSRLKDMNRIRENLDSRIEELEELLRLEREKNLNGCAVHERLNRELQAKYEEANKAREYLEKENSDLKARLKAVTGERDRLSGNIDVLNRSIKSLEEELSRERAKFNSTVPALNNRINELNADNNNLLRDKDRLEKENEELRKKLKSLQLENDLLKAKLDEQYNELNQLREANKNISNLLKNIQNLNQENEELRNRIKLLENELADRNKKIEDLAYINNNYKKKVEEQEVIIAKLREQIKILEDQLAKARKPEPVPPMVMARAMPPPKDYRNIDFYNDDYNDLLLNNKNWPIVDPWLAGLRRNNNGPLRLNLLYKATRDGFAHNNFKDRCMNKPNTLVVVLTQYNKLVGGFTPLMWQKSADSHEYVRDESRKTFLYSITNGKKYKLVKPNYAICNAKELGPIFGGGSDLEIVSECNRYTNNYSHVGHSFDYQGTEEDFFGKKKFLVQDYEVYEVLL